MGALSYMLIACIAYSLIPLVVHLAGGSQAPFLFNAWLRAGVVGGCLLFLMTFSRGVPLRAADVLLIGKRVLVWPANGPIIWAIVGSLDYALFAWSIKFIEISVAAILFEMYPVGIILLASWLFKGETRYRRITPTTALLVLFSVGGLVFANASQVAGFGVLDLSFLWRSLIGVTLVVAAIVAVALSVFGLRWGADLSEELSRGSDPRALELYCVVIALFVVSLVSIPVSLVSGFVAGERMTSGAVLTAVVGGAFANAVASVAWRKSVLTADNLGINAIGFAIPVLSLLWLYWIANADVARWDYLIIGATAIITGNLLINFEAEIRWGFKALILALGTCGAIVYLRGGAFAYLGVEAWLWRGGGYFESITLSATVFTLLLAFRVSRLVARTSEEDARLFIVYRNLDLLSRRGVLDAAVCGRILEIDQSNDSPVVREAYRATRRYIAAVDAASLEEADTQLLSQAEANLDALIRSKQVDIHLGEMFALCIFGLVTIGLALFSRPPQVEGWTRLLADVFAMVVSGVIVFLLVHIQDLQRERDDPKLELPGPTDSEPENPGTSYRDFLALFPDTTRRSFNQWLSIVVGIAIVATYVGLLGHKWLG